MSVKQAYNTSVSLSNSQLSTQAGRKGGLFT